MDLLSGLQDGLLQDLHMTVSSAANLDAQYGQALSGVRLIARHKTD